MSYFLPQNAGGIQAFARSGEADGWYQLAVPGATLTTIPGITVPDGVGGMLVQANGADVYYCFSPADALAGTTAFLILPAGSTLFLPGQAHVRQFCLLLNSGGTPAITVQYYVGDIGPTPLVNIPTVSSGPPVPGTGTVISVNVSGGDTGLGTVGGPITISGTITLTGRARVDTDNTVHVMEFGNDSTGLRGRLDKPFATIAAAVAAMDPGDMLYVWPGTHVCEDVNAVNVSVHLINAILTTSVGFRTFVIPGTGIFTVTSEGESGIVHDGGSSIFESQETYTSLLVKVPYLSNATDAIAVGQGEGCTLDVDARHIESGPEAAAFLGWEDARIKGDIIAEQGAFQITSGQAVVHRGNIEANGSAVEVVDGDFSIYGDIANDSNSSGSCVSTVGNSGIRIFGNLRSTGTNCAAVRIESGGAEIEIHGNVTAESTAAIYAPATDVDSTINVYGDVYCQNRHGIYTYRANVNVYGDIQTEGIITDANGVHAVGDCRVNVYGNILSAAGAGAKTSHDDAEIEIFGNSHSGGRWGIFCIAGGHIIIHGIASSGIREGAYMEVGRLTILGGARSANSTVAVIILSQQSWPNNVLTLGGAARLESDAGAFYTIDCEPGGIDGIRSYGASGNMGIRAGLVVVGTYNIIP